MTEKYHYDRSIHHDENTSYLPKKCIKCGWSYNHPMTDSYADYDFTCPNCGSKETLVTSGEPIS